MILYSTIAKLPELSPEEQVNSTQHFYRELNRFGLTSASDTGGGGHVYPTNYQASKTLASQGKLPIRISNFLFAQKAGTELQDYEKWTAEEKLNLTDLGRAAGGLRGRRGGRESDLVGGRFRELHGSATGVEREDGGGADRRNAGAGKGAMAASVFTPPTTSRSRECSMFSSRSLRKLATRPAGASITPRPSPPQNIARIKAMGGGIAVQNRMAFAGEIFAERYGKEAAASAPPLRQMLDAGIPLGAGTDATRVSSHNPWLSLYWMVTGKDGRRHSTGVA